MTNHDTHDTINTPDSPRHSQHETRNTSNTGQMTVQDIQEAYARYATWIDRLGWLNRLLTGRYRSRQFSQATGRVLDVACGAGTNFQYLPESTEIVGIDISEPLLERARSELETLERNGTVKQMDAQDLAFEDDSFDTVISSFSTCTFPDPIGALREMSRVCRPEGQILLLEHGRSDNDLIARYQEWRADAHYEKSGCRVTQEPLSVVCRAGLPVNEAETAQLGRITRIVCDPVPTTTN
ncbi:MULTISPECIES: class I SAM-dependent methyltransferase [Haloferacaceae]|uniref:Class I SAM-dependent methyltransferase n=1 Tax=Halorubrum glutamatedens TaxID=2707018 RepID=A0ABD5QWN2_9EURY|nr:class I SAM-dependent methyltransferase [Halobellus captivus]